MPKKVSHQSLEEILDVIKKLPEGASITELEAVFKKTISRRTLQRRLEEENNDEALNLGR